MSVDAAIVPRAADPARASVTGAIARASGTTGAGFEYLLATAKIESNLDPRAAAPTSSARGLYQFIEQTWLGTMKEAGAEFGYAREAAAIERLSSGRYVVDDPAMRQAILKLRDDPAANAAMAGVLAQSNSFKLTGTLGRRPTDGELYIAHFLGVGGASRLIKRARNDPSATAAALFPDAAAANRAIFYDHSGRARSVSEVYGVLTGRYAVAARAPVVRQTLAAAGMTGASAQHGVTMVSLFTPQQTRAAPPTEPLALADNSPVFHSLFHAGERSQPVSPAVHHLWASGGVADVVSGSASAAPKLARPQPLDLFSDPTGRFSG